MCGIFAYLSKCKIPESLRKELYERALKCRMRGPD